MNRTRSPAGESKRRKTRRWLRWLKWVLLMLPVLSIMLVLPFAWLPPPASSIMLQNHWAQPKSGSASVYRYQWTPFTEISPHLALAVIAAEDQRFADHYGFDFIEIEQALRDYWQGQRLRGASTISQQVAKNLYLWPLRSAFRKGLEAWFTMWIELLWSKRRILEVYLNIAQFGARDFGAGAASQQFFGKPPAELSAEQAALMAAALPGPALNRVDRPSPYMRQRQQWILKQMRQLGGISYLNKL